LSRNEAWFLATQGLTPIALPLARAIELILGAA
jgi:hypothetical protein